MTLNAALSHAQSGLTFAARGAQVVSSNVANATTPGYGRRGIEAAATILNGAGAGVAVATIRRDSDPLLIAERRRAEAESAHADTRAAALDALEAAFGTPETGDGLGARLTALETALIDAAARPDIEARLAAVLATAGDVATGIAAASDRIQTLRQEADAAIAADVQTMTTALHRIADLNTDIVSARATGRDVNGLVDQRQALIDSLAATVPLRECVRENGTVALYTASGAQLLDGRPATLSFTPAGVVVPAMTAASGALATLTINGHAAPALGANAPLAGGRLEALFDQRDRLAPAAQAGLDALAQDLAQRFSDPGLDPTLPAGAAGLFTVAGGPVPASPAPGLADKIGVNTAVDPGAGGAMWRLRDGIGAPAPGPVGNSVLLSAMADRLAAVQPVMAGPLAGRTLSIPGLAAELATGLSSQAADATETASFAAARTASLRESEARAGVDTDAELQALLQFERLYAANARVIQVVESMFDTLMGI